MKKLTTLAIVLGAGSVYAYGKMLKGELNISGHELDRLVEYHCIDGYSGLSCFGANEMMAEGERKIVSDEIIGDGYGSAWSAYCAMCGKKSMHVVRPGKVQCSNCG